MLIVISGPSSVGKTRTIRELCKLDKRFRKVVSYTTRQKRIDEKEGGDYYFISKKEFIEKIKNDFFLYWKKGQSGFYGFCEIFDSDIYEDIVILDVDTDALIELKRKGYEIVSIFLVSDTMEIIYQRLLNRGRERGILSPDDAEYRFQESLRMLDYIALYDYVLINEDDRRTANILFDIIRIELIKQKKNERISELRKEIVQYKLK